MQEKAQVTVGQKEKELLHSLAAKLSQWEWSDVELHEEIYLLCRNNDYPPQDFFKVAYKVLINKERGPRLAAFILAIGKKKVATLFKGG